MTQSNQIRLCLCVKILKDGLIELLGRIRMDNVPSLTVDQCEIGVRIRLLISNRLLQVLKRQIGRDDTKESSVIRIKGFTIRSNDILRVERVVVIVIEGIRPTGSCLRLRQLIPHLIIIVIGSLPDGHDRIALLDGIHREGTQFRKHVRLSGNGTTIDMRIDRHHMTGDGQ